MATILVVRPVLNPFESAEQRLYEALSHSLAILLKCRLRGTCMVTADLHACSATKEAIESALLVNPDASAVVFFGHGHALGDRAIGHNLEPCLDVNSVDMLDRGGYFVCCHAVKQLGKAAVENGCPWFFGFDDKVWLTPRAQEWIVGYCAMFALFDVLDGKSPHDAYSACMDEYDRMINEILEGPHRRNLEWIYSTVLLEDNKKAFKLLVKGNNPGGIVMLESPEKANNDSLTDEDIDKGIEIVQKWVDDPASRPSDFLAMAGSGESVRPEDLLKTLVDKRDTGKWGEDDQAEKFLRKVVTAYRD